MVCWDMKDKSHRSHHQRCSFTSFWKTLFTAVVTSKYSLCDHINLKQINAVNSVFYFLLIFFILLFYIMYQSFNSLVFWLLLFVLFAFLLFRRWIYKVLTLAIRSCAYILSKSVSKRNFWSAVNWRGSHTALWLHRRNKNVFSDCLRRLCDKSGGLRVPDSRSSCTVSSVAEVGARTMSIINKQIAF